MLLNGVPGKHFWCKCGVRQGDPLSPYLFLLCVEGVSALIKKAQHDGMIRGIAFGGTGPRITHLLFADNSIVFLEGTEDSMRALGDILVR